MKLRAPQALKGQTIKAAEHGTPVTFKGVLLSDVLAKVQAPVGEKLRGKALAQYLLIEAADGYRAVFALAELDPAFSDKRVYLAVKRDCQPLSEKEGPFRIVSPDEKKAGAVGAAGDGAQNQRGAVNRRKRHFTSVHSASHPSRARIFLPSAIPRAL